MEMHNLVIEQEDAALLDQCLARYLEDTGVRVVMLMGRDGHLISMQGPSKGIDVESLCALAVGAFASSEALARMAGEDNFNTIFHQGVRCNVYIAMVGEHHLLLSLFDYHASAPLVRLQAKITSEAIVNIIERAYTRTRVAHVDA
ncbi:MAG TPA: roadblock/LC7 domain-containing protein [Armatimonadota bacterium]|nr:roadblock/LC7 domain-containing protein [Armatimonadota bacterium]